MTEKTLYDFRINQPGHGRLHVGIMAESYMDARLIADHIEDGREDKQNEIDDSIRIAVEIESKV